MGAKGEFVRTSLTEIEAKKIEAHARYATQQFANYYRRTLAAYCLALDEPVTEKDFIVVTGRYAITEIGLVPVEYADALEEAGFTTDPEIWAEVNA